MRAPADHRNPPRRRALRVLRVSRLVADLGRAEAFYRDALGFRRAGGGAPDAAALAALGRAGGRAAQAVMRLGTEEVALVRLDPPGAPYPPDGRSDDLWFQHLAIVVSDMAAAHARLLARSFRPISTAGPEQLPAENGGVIAFKFRDPDGHPLEFLQFPPGEGRPVWQGRAGDGPCLGIDHTALAVADAARSGRFYADLGFRETSRSRNHGPAQARLDGLPGADLTVRGLRPESAEGPGLELLGYHPSGRGAAALAADSCARDWATVLASGMGNGAAEMLRDPDGHRVLLSGSRPETTDPA